MNARERVKYIDEDVLYYIVTKMVAQKHLNLSHSQAHYYIILLWNYYQLTNGFDCFCFCDSLC